MRTDRYFVNFPGMILYLLLIDLVVFFVGRIRI